MENHQKHGLDGKRWRKCLSRHIGHDSPRRCRWPSVRGRPPRVTTMRGHCLLSEGGALFWFHEGLVALQLRERVDKTLNSGCWVGPRKVRCFVILRNFGYGPFDFYRNFHKALFHFEEGRPRSEYFSARTADCIFLSNFLGDFPDSQLTFHVTKSFRLHWAEISLNTVLNIFSLSLPGRYIPKTALE